MVPALVVAALPVVPRATPPEGWARFWRHAMTRSRRPHVATPPVPGIQPAASWMDATIRWARRTRGQSRAAVQHSDETRRRHDARHRRGTCSWWPSACFGSWSGGCCVASRRDAFATRSIDAYKTIFLHHVLQLALGVIQLSLRRHVQALPIF